MIFKTDLMLERLDQQLFLFLNSINSPFWDKVMYAVSGTAIWIPLYIVILIFMAKKYRRKFLVLVLFITVAVLIADQSSVRLFKNAFERLRPCHEPALSGLVHIVKGECGGLYGFVSSHATNSFNVALLSLLLIKNKWYSAFIIFWAAVISYSRIYLGVHYPGDVICGALLGSLVGWIIFKLFELTDDKMLNDKEFFKK
ncbi:MAG: phosphatase PAP2 family protein [Bacteroidales bacterium]|nr:phosphatase PAP2 family protein [Bacteroidales bacterium]